MVHRRSTILRSLGQLVVSDLSVTSPQGSASQDLASQVLRSRRVKTLRSMVVRRLDMEHRRVAWDRLLPGGTQPHPWRLPSPSCLDSRYLGQCPPQSNRQATHA